MLVFPSEGGSAWDFENNGIASCEGCSKAAGSKLYCVDAFDSESWSHGGSRSRSARGSTSATSRGSSTRWSPFIHDDLGGAQDILATGCSMGAFHAANFVLRRADLFPAAICLSGNYDVWTSPSEVASCPRRPPRLAALARSFLLVCGQGMWEDTTGALESTKRLAWLLGEKGIRHELDLWGHDVPHDWPSWRAQIAHHLPRFC